MGLTAADIYLPWQLSFGKLNPKLSIIPESVALQKFVGVLTSTTDVDFYVFCYYNNSWK